MARHFDKDLGIVRRRTLKLEYEDGVFWITGVISDVELQALYLILREVSRPFDKMLESGVSEILDKVWEDREPVTVSYVVADDEVVTSHVERGSDLAAAVRTLQFFRQVLFCDDKD